MVTRSLEYDIEFFYSKPRIDLFILVQVSEDFETLKTFILNFAKTHKKFYIFTPHEKIITDLLLDKMLKLLNDLNNRGFEVYLCMTTTSSNPYFLNPLCSILHYTGKYAKDKNQVGTKNVSEKIKILDLDFYKNTKKEIKGLFSIRKTDYYRDLFYTNFDGKFDGIFRYSRMDRGRNTGQHSPVTFDTLIKEYNQSFVSFFFETATNESTNSFTEKSMIALLSKTLPVLFITKPNQIKELNEMGFYFFNEWFDYTEVNENSSDIEKVNLFISCIKKFNQLSINDVKNIYQENITRVKQNHDIVKELLLTETDYKQPNLVINKSIF